MQTDFGRKFRDGVGAQGAVRGGWEAAARRERGGLARRGLMPVAAFRADAERDLVAGAALVAGSAERETRRRTQCREQPAPYLCVRRGTLSSARRGESARYAITHALLSCSTTENAAVPMRSRIPR
jgi:hypothetical protein